MHLTNLCLTALLAIRVSASPTLDKRAISCLRVGATATASWTNAAGQSCRWSGVVGSNFGANSVNGGEYAVHPSIISSLWYLTYFVGTAVTAAAEQAAQAPQSATGGARDRNCGAGYNAAIDDTIGGAAAGCGQTNPSNAAVRPSTSPTCS
ncbi:hypothetical protein PTT_20350 [Pyrenophora teres f. teres 0-1]|uniref:DUF8213 domain-containing protein n=1 Tax=Pyrenophora teres f. teres (strain 0-1) TaxID=861557 RepID=E3SAX4_PYRTT|nr:hypothetical protein PTT_20350 [Pyrenophora teres f. teres 0-1]